MKYRAEIDGLRALAIIPVILFHADFSFIPGGYIGVDIFFVISGYLITTIILAEKEQGKFSIINFYERRTRRILPPLFFVMFASLFPAWLFLIPKDLKDFAQSLVSTSSFSSNILFWLETGYWERGNELKPLLHTWSLAVEEQYYILFPIFLMVMWKFSRPWILGSLVLITIISLLLTQAVVYNYPTAAFFLLPTRAWELAIGAIIAFYLLYRKPTMRKIVANKIVDEILGLTGLLMIIGATLVFNKNILFPSFYTLIPTLGTGLIIIFSSPNTLIGRFLAFKPIVGIGLISYSTYLWHQPLFAFARHSQSPEPDTLLYTALIFASFVCGYLSWRFIERPFRNKNAVSRKVIFSFSAVCATVFIAIGIVGDLNNGFPERFKLSQSIKSDFVHYQPPCEGGFQGNVRTLDACILGNTTSDQRIDFAVLGDSHARALLPAFDTIAQSIASKYVYMGTDACLPLLGVDIRKGNYENGVCDSFAASQFNYVKANDIDKIFLVARWTMYVDGDYKDKDAFFLVDNERTELTKENSQAVFISAVKRTLNEYQNIGVHVYIVEQIPQQNIDIKSLYYKLSNFDFTESEFNNFILEQSIPRDKSNNLQAFTRDTFKQYAKNNHVTTINLDSDYCDDHVCNIGDINHSIYKDYTHLSIYGANMSVDKLKSYLQPTSDATINAVN